MIISITDDTSEDFTALIDKKDKRVKDILIKLPNQSYINLKSVYNVKKIQMLLDEVLDFCEG